MTTLLASSLPWVLALTLDPTTVQELALGGATLVILLGMWLCWGAADQRMVIEEELKDGKVSADSAHQKIRRIRWVGPGVTVLGVGVLTYVVMR